MPEPDDVFWDGTKLVHTNKGGKLTRGQAAALDAAIGNFIFQWVPGGDILSGLFGLRDIAYDYANKTEHPEDKGMAVNFLSDLAGLVPGGSLDIISGAGNIADALFGISGFDLVSYLTEKIDLLIKENKTKQNKKENPNT